MSTKFLRRGTEFSVVDSTALNVLDKLPGGNYTIKEDPQSGMLYLEKFDDFRNPPKFYGDTLTKSDRILNTFRNRKAGTGVLLSGEKGSGKTLLARTICLKAQDLDIPTIVINAPWSGDKFFTFLNSITQECIVLVDEFEKVYSGAKDDNNRPKAGTFFDSPAQNAILTLLDGVFQSKKMFLLTCNDKYGINRNMLNRPGRIYYALEFHGLDRSFVEEYARDNLNDKDKVHQVVRVGTIIGDFNFDMLQALVEEMNRYNENASQSLAMLNVSPERDWAKWKVKLHLGGDREARRLSWMHPTEFENPLTKNEGMSITTQLRKTCAVKSNVDILPDADAYDNDDDNIQYTAKFEQDHLEEMNDRELVYKNQHGDILYLERQTYMSPAWREFVSPKAKKATGK